MAKVAGLAERAGSCSKPLCNLRAPLNRHHKGHEAIWVGTWTHKRGETRYDAFVKRYHEFHEEDCVRICMPHHAEIHYLYDKIVEEDLAETKLPLYLYSWEQAERLMARLRDACNEWLAKRTPGLSSAYYDKVKISRRKRLRKKTIKKQETLKKLADKEQALIKDTKRRRRKKKR